MSQPNLPTNWSWVKLGDVCEILDSKRIPINSTERQKRITGKLEKELYPYYGATGHVGFIDDYIFEGEYILVGEDGAPFLDLYKDKAYLVKGKFWVNNHAHILLFNGSNRFLCFYLNTIDYRPFVTGTTRLKLNQSSLKQVPIKYPPLSVQHRIVEKIEELFSELDNGIENLKKAKEQIKTYRQAVLKFAFEGKLTQGKSENSALPIGWKWVKLGVVIKFIGSGATPRGGRSVYSDVGVTFIRSQNVYPNELRLDDVAFISEEINETLSRSVVKPNDVLLNITGASIGRATFVPSFIKRANVNQHVCILRISQQEVEPKYLSSFLNSPFAQDYISKIQIGATRQALNYSQIKSFPFPLTSLVQQTQIVQEIESRFSVADKMEQSIDKSLQKAEALRQSILKQAFEGKLV